MHTPAPWHVENEPMNVWDKKGRLICRCFGITALGLDCKEMDANARLIAAAPEMLMALKGLLDCQCHGGSGDYCKHVSQAEKVIIKAERTNPSVESVESG